MNQSLLELFGSARRVGVPLVTVATADQNSTVYALQSQHDKYPIVQWDAARGMTPVNEAGRTALSVAQIDPKKTYGFAPAMDAAEKLPQAAIVFVRNAHRFLHSTEPLAVAANVQAVSNLRDTFKSNFRTLVMLGPSVPMPTELAHDVVSLEHPLPTPEELRVVIEQVCDSVDNFPKQPGAVIDKAVEAVRGLSEFEAEQDTAMSLRDDGLDVHAMWERKNVTIDQTPGLSVYRGTETFKDLRGLDAVTERLLDHVHARTPVGVVVWIDEGADVFANVEHDTSGNKTDQQRALLVEMESNNWRGVIGVGVPGSGKSAIARAFGNEAGVPTISVDFGDMESKWQGESEQHLRQAIQVIKAVGGGHAFFVLTCNSLAGIRPQFMRRFKRGVFFFDLPTKVEREAIWKVYRAKYEIDPKDRQPDDDGWTGAEIRECCESAWDTGKTLAQAARFIVPVSRSRGKEIEEMRREAHGRFLSASRHGVYEHSAEPMAKPLRSIALPGARTKES